MLRLFGTAALSAALAVGLAACEKQAPSKDEGDHEAASKVAESSEPHGDDHAGHDHAGHDHGDSHAPDPDQVAVGGHDGTPPPTGRDPRQPRTYAPDDVVAEPGEVPKRAPSGLSGNEDQPDDASGCAALGPKFDEIARAELDQAVTDPAERARYEPQVAMVRQQFVSLCQQENWSDEAKQCIRDADPTKGFAQCEDAIVASRASHARTDASQQLESADPKKVAQCRPMAQNVVKLAEKQMLDNAQTEQDKKLARQMLEPMQMQLTAQCASQDWSKEARDCLAKAKTMEDTQPCQQMLPQAGPPGGPQGAPQRGGAPPHP